MHRRLRLQVVLAVLASSALAAAIAASASSGDATSAVTRPALRPLTPSSLGPIRFTMTRTRVRTVTGRGLTPRGTFCASPSGVGSVVLEFARGRVDAIGLVRRGAPTNTGLRVGDSDDDIVAAYGKRVAHVGGSTGDDNAQGADYVYTPPGSRFRLSFWTHHGRITQIWAVFARDARRDEFCA